LSLHINDIFFTFQGEGVNSGRRALFVRMPYCNLSCPWCDTNFDSHKEWNEIEFLHFSKLENTRFAVLTGGEPTMHKHTSRIIELLKTIDYEIAIETNGNFQIPTGVDFVTVSPKRYATIPFGIHSDAMIKANEFKYVVEENFDFSILKKHNTTDGRRYSLSPEFNRFQLSLQEIFQYTKENPIWRISLQTHKWMNIP
jgi:7-carboxy-7-deazaguanine synthase